MIYAGLHVRQTIMHEILNKSLQGNAEQRLSDVPTEMEEEQRLFIQERMRSTLGKGARPITEEDSGAILPNSITRYFAKEIDVVDLSKSLAQHLQKTQPTSSPAGLFLVCECDMDGSRALLLAKAEHERGVRAPQETLPDGRVTFSIELLKDLLFTTASRIYKVAVFVEKDEEEERLRGWVVDRQMAGSSIAQYFLSIFLSCKLTERSDVFTQRFYEGTERFINAMGDPEKQARYTVSLISEMHKNDSGLSVQGFASSYLEEDDRDDFTAMMQSEKVPPRQFDKDVTLIKGQLLRLKLETASGVTVLLPPGAIEDGIVTIDENLDETSTVSIRDRISKFGGHGTSRTNQQSVENE